MDSNITDDVDQKLKLTGEGDQAQQQQSLTPLIQDTTDLKKKRKKKKKNKDKGAAGDEGADDDAGDDAADAKEANQEAAGNGETQAKPKKVEEQKESEI